MLSEKSRPSSPPPRRKRSNQSPNTRFPLGDRNARNGSGRNYQHRPRQMEMEYPLERPILRESKTRDGRSTKQRNNIGKRKPDRGSHNKKKEKTESKERETKTRKVYRKKKVFRKWVLLAVFFVPLGMIWLEYYIGKLIGLEDIRDTYEDQMVDPWDLLRRDFNASRVREGGDIPSLPQMAYSSQLVCPAGQRRMINVHNPLSHSVGSGRRLIPMIVHQQSKSRCLTLKVDKATIKWATTFKRWSYYMHDEDSRTRLFDTYCGGEIPTCEFPLLNQIVTTCFHNQTNFRNHHRYYSLKTELWKFLTLWLYGGVYVDIDFLPQNFSPTTLGKDDDGFLVIDSNTKMLSTKLMAVSPRHPIMYYAVQQILLSLLAEESPSSAADHNTESENNISGSSILGQAFRMFQDEAEGGKNNFSPGVFHGVMSRTVRIVATNGLNIKTQSGGENDLVISIFRSEKEKEAEYQKMGMTADSKNSMLKKAADDGESGVSPHLSCRQKLYHSFT